MARKGKPRYPWSILEMEPTEDVTLVKRAYAARLKVTRPEDDPAAFQALVEARDNALQLTKGNVQTKTSTHSTSDLPLTIGPQDKHQQSVAGTQVPNEAAEDDLALEVVGDSADHVVEADSNWSGNAFNFDAEQVEIILEDIRHFFDPENFEAESKRADRALASLALLSIAQKDWLERPIAELVAKSLPNAIRFQELRYPSVVKRGMEITWLINALDDYYGWSNNDVRFGELAHHVNSDAIDDLHQLLNKQTKLSQTKPVRFKRPWYTNGIGWFVLLIIGIKVFVALFGRH